MDDVLGPLDGVDESRAALLKLAELWQREKLAHRRQERSLRDAIPFAERVRRGLALQNLRYENSESAGAGHCQIWFHLEQEGALADGRINVGDSVVMWTGSHAKRQSGVVGRRGQSRICVVVDSDYDRFVETGPMRLDLEASEITFERGEAAIQSFLDADELAPMRKLLFGCDVPRFGNAESVSFRDEGLNDSQRGAVLLALKAEQVALIHGPPGTGKTRTLVEVVRQQLMLERTVLVTAASNTAVDHLTSQLMKRGIRPLRLGHPARVAEALRPRTAEALMEETDEYRIARRWQSEARAMREKMRKLKERGSASRGEGRGLLAEANRLNSEARRMLKAARAKVLRRARVVCTTAAGADSSILGSTQFDVVVLDEATQAPDPIALAALQRGRIAVLAGDPCQLSPTIVDPDAARDGLSSTLFERASRRWSAEATHVLTVQYRMSAGLMRFPSESMYSGRLIADSSVAGRSLRDLPGVSADLERSQPWVLVDTSGSGDTESVDEESLSTFNQAQASLTAREVRRLVLRGVLPKDIAAITPYSAQVRLLRTLLADDVAAGLEIGTVDGFQGREKEAIVVDLVRSNPDRALGFLADTRRTNVAVTRAKRFLVVICDGSTVCGHQYYRRLIASAHRDGVWEAAAPE